MLADLLGGDDQKPAQTFLDWAVKAYRTERVAVPMKADTVIRASSIGWMCFREEVLAARHGITRKEVVSADSNWTYSVGHAVHWAMQNEVLGPKGQIVGEWRCRSCGDHQGGAEDYDLRPYPEDCPKCHSPELGFEYVELPLYDSELLIRGHCDGFHPNGVDIWEFKSSNSYAMKAIRQGQIWPAYKVQGQIYLHLTGRKRFRFLFVDKGENVLKRAWHPMLIERDQKEIDAKKKAIVQMREAIASPKKKLPERICANETCDRAKNCPVVTQCFASP